MSAISPLPVRPTPPPSAWAAVLVSVLGAMLLAQCASASRATVKPAIVPPLRDEAPGVHLTLEKTELTGDGWLRVRVQAELRGAPAHPHDWDCVVRWWWADGSSKPISHGSKAPCENSGERFFPKVLDVMGGTGVNVRVWDARGYLIGDAHVNVPLAGGQ